METEIDGGSKSKALIVYEKHLPALTREYIKNRLKIHDSIAIGDAITWMVVLTALYYVAVAATVVYAVYNVYSAVTAPKPPKVSFGSLEDSEGGGTSGIGGSGSPRYGFGGLRNTATSELPIPVLYGELKMAGNAIYQDTWDTDIVKRLVSLCEGEVNSVTDVRVNNIPIVEIDGCSYTAYTGTATQTVDSRASNYVYGLRNLAYIALTLQSGDKLKGGEPTITSLVQGLKIKIYNGTTWQTAPTYSNNPAAVIRDFLTNARYGVGLSESAIDDDSFAEVYTYCNVLVSNNNGGTEARFTLNVVLDSRKPVVDILNDLLVSFGGMLVFDGIKLKLKVEKSDPPIQAFDMDNIVEHSFKYEMASKDDTPNRLRVLYIDPSQNYTKVYAIAEDKIAQDQLAIIENNDGLRSRDIALLGVTRFSQASRIALQYLNIAKYCSAIVNFSTRTEGLFCEAGDVITISHDVSAWTKKPFRITSMVEKEDEVVDITAREHNASIYNDGYASAIQLYSYGAPPNPYLAVADVTNMSLSEFGYRNASGAHVANIDVSWTAPSVKTLLASYLVQVSIDGGSYQDVVKIDPTATAYRITNVRTGSTYIVKIKTISTNDIVSTGTISSSIAIVGKDTPPANVIGFSAGQTLDRVTFTWENVTDVDFWCYEIRQGSTWDVAAVIQTGILTNRYDLFGFTTGQKTYLVKARDNSGNYSSTASSVTITIVAPPDQNIVYTSGEWIRSTLSRLAGTRSSGCQLEYTTDKNSGQYEKVIGLKSTYQFDISSLTFDVDNVNFDTNLVATEETYETIPFDIGILYTGQILIDHAVSNTAGGTLSIEFSYSTDNVTWSSYGTWTPSSVTFRYVKFRFKLKTTQSAFDIRLTDFTISVDVVDKTDSGSVSIPVTGVSVVFNSTFNEVPIVTVGLAAAGGRYHRLANITNTGFDIYAYASGDAAATATGNWFARGY